MPAAMILKPFKNKLFIILFMFQNNKMVPEKLKK